MIAEKAILDEVNKLAPEDLEPLPEQAPRKKYPIVRIKYLMALVSVMIIYPWVALPSHVHVDNRPAYIVDRVQQYYKPVQKCVSGDYSSFDGSADGGCSFVSNESISIYTYQNLTNNKVCVVRRDVYMSQYQSVIGKLVKCNWKDIDIL